MNVPGLFENHRGERRLEFSAETRSRKPDITQGQDSGAFTMGRHRVQLK